jgi:hypothetical protein
MPIPNEKDPRGSKLPIGRGKTVVCECGGVFTALASLTFSCVPVRNRERRESIER